MTTTFLTRGVTVFLGRRSDRHWRRGRRESRPIPLDRVAQPVPQPVGRTPAEYPLGLGTVEILSRDFVGGFVEHDRLEIGPACKIEDQSDNGEHRLRLATAEVERLPGRRVAGQTLGQRQVRIDRVPYVKVFADVRPVTPDDRALATERRDDRLWHQ